jgi:hypothetical protein
MIFKLLRGGLAVAKRIIRTFLERSLRWLRQRPQYKAILHSVLRLAPPLRRKLIGFANARAVEAPRIDLPLDVSSPLISSSVVNPVWVPEPTWNIEADPQVLREWRAIISPRDAGQ